jgi:hypothetical protein
MSNITFNLATPGDDPELRRLLRENPFSQFPLSESPITSLELI